MKHIKTISIILCGLLNGTIEASESNAYKANTSQSRNSPQSSSPIPIVRTIPLKKKQNGSFSSSYSPKYHQTSSQMNSFSTSVSPSLSSTSTDPYAILVNKFFVKSKGKYLLINTDGSLNENKYITDEDKTSYLNRYEAQLIIKNNETSLTTTRLIPLGGKPINCESSMQAHLTNKQKKQLQKLSPDKKIIASDDLQNLYYISYMNNSIDSSEQS